MACSLGGGAVNNSKEPDAVRRPGLSKKGVNAILGEQNIIHSTLLPFMNFIMLFLFFIAYARDEAKKNKWQMQTDAVVKMAMRNKLVKLKPKALQIKKE